MAIDLLESVVIRQLGQCEYLPIYEAMRQFTEQRTETTPDELWVLEHFPVYTLGQAGKIEHVLNPQSIPVHFIDRGGQVTYHGLGQLVVYILMDVQRRHWGIRQLVTALEQAIIDYLSSYQIVANRREKAPGVYVNEAKIAALGLRIRHGRSYHGLSFNINMDLSPFLGINPCGYAAMPVTQLAVLEKEIEFQTVQRQFINYLLHVLEYQHTLNIE